METEYKKWTEYVENGVIPTRSLIYHLQEVHKQCADDYNESDKIDLNEIIESISNDEGNWTIIFYKVPSSRLVLNLIYIFENKLPFDNLELVLFNSAFSSNVTFSSVTGTAGLHISELFAYLENNKATV